MLQEDLSQRGMRLVKTEGTIVSHSMVGRIESGEDRGMSGKRQGHRRNGIGKTDTLGGKSIEHRRCRCLVSVTSEAIRSGRVERHHDYIEALGRTAGPRVFDVASGGAAGQVNRGDYAHNQRRNRYYEPPTPDPLGGCC